MEDRPKVAITQPFHLGGHGGIKRVIEGVVENVKGFDFEIVTPEPDESSIGNLRSEAEVRSFKKRLPGWGIDYRRPKVKRMLEEYDLIWNNSLMINDAIRNVNTPIVTTFHSIAHNPPTELPVTWSRLKNSVQWKLFQRGVRSLQDSEKVICVSKRSRDVISRRVNCNSVTVYNGGDYLDTGISKEDGGYIFCADGPTMGLYIAARIGYPVKLLKKTPGLVKMAEKHNAEVEFIERDVDDSEMAQLYRNCSFYVSGAFHDGFGLTPIEANFFGKPALVYDKEVHNENIEDGVNGYACLNTHEMIERARELAENPDMRREMGRKAHDYVQDRFTWKGAAERYEEEFRSAL